VNFGLVLLVLGGFVLGGAWSVWKLDADSDGRSGPQVALAVVLLIAALLTTASGILRLI
jgi:hypothetical protein